MNGADTLSYFFFCNFLLPFPFTIAAGNPSHQKPNFPFNLTRTITLFTNVNDGHYVITAFFFFLLLYTVFQEKELLFLDNSDNYHDVYSTG